MNDICRDKDILNIRKLNIPLQAPPVDLDVEQLSK